MMIKTENGSNDNKKLPKSVSLWLLAWGFLIGNAIGGLLLIFNLFAWVFLNLGCILLFFIIDWRYGAIIQSYFPRFAKLLKEKDDNEKS